MLPEIIRYRIGDDRADAFIEAYRKAGESLTASPHCSGYELLRKSAQFREFFAHIKPYVGDILEMKHYEATGVVG